LHSASEVKKKTLKNTGTKAASSTKKSDLLYHKYSQMVVCEIFFDCQL